MINAGPTIEAWDAVRTMSNRATGTLGAKLADAAAVRGAKVTLVAGKGTPATRVDVSRIDVESADEMLKACLHAAKGVDVFVGTAAVSDFRFAETSEHKLKRQGQAELTVKLIENPDIIQSVANMPQRPTQVVAFAAESENHVAHAQAKLEQKGVDAVVANDVSNMGVDSAAGWWITEEDVRNLPSQNKQEFVVTLMDCICKP